MVVMVALQLPATPTPTQSRQEAANERAQVAGDDKATFARNSGVILFFFEACLPFFSFSTSRCALFRRHRTQRNWFLSLCTRWETNPCGLPRALT